MKAVEECIEEMLIRLDEFCGMTDMVRLASEDLGESKCFLFMLSPLEAILRVI